MSTVYDMEQLVVIIDCWANGSRQIDEIGRDVMILYFHWFLCWKVILFFNDNPPIMIFFKIECLALHPIDLLVRTLSWSISTINHKYMA